MVRLFIFAVSVAFVAYVGGCGNSTSPPDGGGGGSTSPPDGGDCHPTWQLDGGVLTTHPCPPSSSSGAT